MFLQKGCSEKIATKKIAIKTSFDEALGFSSATLKRDR